MMTLTLTNGKAYVWNADDWLKLREEHRIVGTLIGCSSQLPMVLLPEEVTLLLENKVIRLAHFPSLSRVPGNGVKEEFEKYRKRIYEEQRNYCLQERKRQVTSMIDQIIEGKRRKLLGLKKMKKENSKIRKPIVHQETGSPDQETEIHIDKEALLKEELDKIVPLQVNNTLVQTFTAYPWLRVEDACNVKWQYPSNHKEALCYRTFKDLWERGYYLTSGQKFGGDFLAYPGDPVKFHAHFLIYCIENDSPISPKQLVAFGRTGTSVRKTVLLASFSVTGGKVVYQSLKWNSNLAPSI